MKNICPLRYLTETFGGKWKMPIICILADASPKRYSVIKRRLGGITNMMLAQSLTERGKGALPMLTAAAQWAVSEMEGEGFSANCGECRSLC